MDIFDKLFIYPLDEILSDKEVTAVIKLNTITQPYRYLYIYVCTHVTRVC